MSHFIEIVTLNPPCIVHFSCPGHNELAAKHVLRPLIRRVGEFHGEHKANMLASVMSSRSCRVTMRDSEGIEHTAEVTAETLYEAVALGLRAIRQSSWVEDLTQNAEVRVLIRKKPVEHSLTLRKFIQWVEQPARSPKEITTRNRIKEILGLLTTRVS